MKKTMSIAVAAMLCVSGAFAVEGNPLTTTLQMDEQDGIQLGKEKIAQIRKDYTEGRYNHFLKEMDKSYDEAIDHEEVFGLGKMRRGAIDLENWLDGVKTIKEETNRELLIAVSGLNNRFSEKVRNVAKTDGLENLFITYHQMQPGTGKTSDENALISLDLEYEFKTIHLDQPKTEIPEGFDKNDLYYVLKMEQMDKTLLASQSFSDLILKDQIDTFASDFDARLSRHIDLLDLKSLVKTKSTDQTENRVACVLQSHQQKIQELARSYLAANQ